ncbi:MAG: transcription elongation factor GreA [Candidatus Komeilibacteria bacterium RIFCSPLOWO2_02_FULL_48_11]|uniref:Transcription elongation factor GreA n=1 Tax=Candidatus Komeilibacteria bacterium RIFCSPLOWO2_02_FULL_48_11 TaxID=1798553 RepID=A0A1G2BUS2_9BACT|nr:MAG: transcription elongation factor GreA [Candidatus Komeilibacteria bacterium RIFCSPLOWO2_02_FULL_48_11]
MPDKTTYLTDDGYKKLKEEVEHLKNVRRIEIASRIKEAKELGDLSENAEYADAREEQSFVEGRIMEIEAALKNAEVISSLKSEPNRVDIGDVITVEKEGAQQAYTIVGSNEANPAEGRISNESPLGQAFLGKYKGDACEVKTPKGPAVYKIIDIA